MRNVAEVHRVYASDLKAGPFNDERNGELYQFIVAADAADAPPESALKRAVQRNVEQRARREEEDEEHKSESKRKGVGKKIAAKIIRTAGRVILRAAKAGLRMMWTVTKFLGRIVARFILPGILQGLAAMLTTPLGWGLGALVGAGALGYFLYKTMFKDESPDVVRAQSQNLTGDQLNEKLDDENVFDQAESNMLSRLGLSSDDMLELRTTQLQRTGLEATLYAVDEMAKLQGRPAATGVAVTGTLGTGTYGAAVPQLSPNSDKSYPLKGDAKSRLDSVVRGMNAAGMTDPNERAMFLAQLAHESGNFRYMREIWNPAQVPAQGRYEGRKDLGNLQPGDGFRFRGRGFIQVTGRTNYRQAGQYIGIDLEADPDLASDPDVAVKIALWYWRKARPKIPQLAKAGDIRGVTKLINGGYNGLQDRVNKFYQYQKKLASGEIGQTEATADLPPATPPMTQQQQQLVAEKKQVEQNARNLHVSQPQATNTQYLKMGNKVMAVNP
ncbi:chitinase [Achromobacter phage Motura]|uniref:Chitinase n=1 Tax=Achromobacter phage Motura TaxID=2591403 RepID=A0A514CT26_9CAUD|nr:endolysin [Achromobacter phage Motura]QDH83648.1 chitinase [Achromobacter phage Motura]